jgi:hypothetical protein
VAQPILATNLADSDAVETFWRAKDADQMMRVLSKSIDSFVRAAAPIGLIACLGAGLFAARVADAAVLSLDYSLTPIGGGLYHYDFTLTLDNADGTWVSGQEFDWIVLGDVAGPPNDGIGALTDWSWDVVPAPFTTDTSFGGHNGPTLCYGPSCGTAGWTPGLNEFITFSGTSSALLEAGELFWSAVVHSTGSAAHYFELANYSPVPIPAALPLFASGLVFLGFAARRRKKRNAERA